MINGLAYDRIRKPNGQAAAAGSTFAVTIERLDASIGGELDWLPYGSPEPSTTVVGPSPNHPTLLWEGVFTLSINDPQDPPRRLVIKEYESWYDDRIFTTKSEGQSQESAGPPGKRLVYADVIPLEQVRLQGTPRRQ